MTEALEQTNDSIENVLKNPQSEYKKRIRQLINKKRDCFVCREFFCFHFLFVLLNKLCETMKCTLWLFKTN